MFGVAGVVYCAIFMVYRWLSGSYARGSELHRALSIKQKPSFGTHMSPIKSLILVAMFNTADMAHYDAPKFLSMVGSNVSEFAKLTKSGFFCAFAVSAIILTAGFSTFGGGSVLFSKSLSQKPWVLNLDHRIVRFQHYVVGQHFRCSTPRNLNPIPGACEP
jgi:hypothetical protein